MELQQNFKIKHCELVGIQWIDSIEKGNNNFSLNPIVIARSLLHSFAKRPDNIYNFYQRWKIEKMQK